MSAGELNAASRGQQRLSTDDLLLKLTDDSQKQVKENNDNNNSKKQKHVKRENALGVNEEARQQRVF